MNLVSLSRLDITGRLDSRTPLCVIEEISNAHGIRFESERLLDERYVSKLLQEIGTTDVPAVRTPYDDRTLEYIARFVNNKTKWSKTTVIDAFVFLQRYMGAGCELPPDDFKSGLQTPTDPRCLNACILYKLCRRHDIRVSRETSLGDMTLAIRLLLVPAASLRNLLLSRIPNEKNQLVNMLLLTGSRDINIHNLLNNGGVIAEDRVGHDELIVSHRSLLEPGAALKRVKPRTNNEAVVLAALNYKFDLSDMRSPILEYELLERNPYIPSDPQIRNALKRNPNLLRLDINFNPNLPIGLYQDADLRALASRSGFQANDITSTSPYELLQMAYIANTFYHGFYPNIINAETPFSGDEIIDLDDNVIICYGSRMTGLVALRFSELARSFRSNRNFRNPLYRDDARGVVLIPSEPFFDGVTLRKLKILCANPIPGESQDCMNERHDLYQSIMETELFNDGNNVKCRELYETFNRSDEMNKGRIRQAFNKFLELAMFMRGWKRYTPYPISSVPPVENQNLVDINVTEAMNIFENLCVGMNELGNMILDLPLLEYRNGEYVAASDVNQGFTLKDRIAIVKQGGAANNSNVNSCIRLTSNWFAASAHRYMQVVGMPPPFDIEGLRHIS